MAMGYSLLYVLENLFAALLTGLFIGYVYRKTHRGLSYSQSLVITLVLMCLIVCSVMMVIGSNLARAFALVGALTIVRFRTVVKDTRDTAFIFFALTWVGVKALALLENKVRIAGYTRQGAA